MFGAKKSVQINPFKLSLIFLVTTSQFTTLNPFVLSILHECITSLCKKCIISCFRKEWGGREGGQKDRPAPAIFSNSFSLRFQYAKVSYFGTLVTSFPCHTCFFFQKPQQGTAHSFCSSHSQDARQDRKDINAACNYREGDGLRVWMKSTNLVREKH